MTRYKQQMDVDDDVSSLGSNRTEEMSAGNTRIRYHMGFSWWRSRTVLEKVLLVALLLSLIVVLALTVVIQVHQHPPNFLLFHNSSVISGLVTSTTRQPGYTMNKGSKGPKGPVCLSSDCVIVAGRVLASMDRSVNPCDDFYKYSCGGYIESHAPPDGKASWGTLSKLASDNQYILKKILESENESPSKAESKAKMFYRSCVDKNNTMQKRGAKPLLEQMKTIGFKEWGEKVSTKYRVELDVINSKINMASGALFSWGVAEDDKHSDVNVLQFEQGGLTLPSRDSYLNETEKSVALAYVDYIAKIGELLGASKNDSLRVAENIFEVEMRIANFTEPPEKHRDVNKLYKSMKLEDLTTLAPFMDWQKFVNAAFKKIDKVVESSIRVVVFASNFLKSVNNLVKDLNASQEGRDKLHHYLMWQYVQSFVNLLSDEFRNAEKILTQAQEGITGEEETWRQCVVATDMAMGPAVGAMYIKKAFSPNSKEQLHAMLRGIRDKFKDSLRTSKWMEKKTINAALQKANAITEMIGGPDYIMNPVELDKKFVELNLQEDDFFGNNLKITELRSKESLRRLFEPVNKTRWDMTASTVNAYYSPTRNEIVFPAGILQPPLFWDKNPHSLNYGAVGVVMGHELTHAFDNQGRDYDKDGNLAQWWQPKTVTAFKELSKCFVKQYSDYTLANEHLNGNLSLGENIADNGGLKASYRAYQSWVEANGKEELPLPGLNLTHYQLFFLGFSQAWCSTMTKERAHMEIQRDPHVPPEFRVRGTLSNFKEFAKQFNCPLGSNMNPRVKCNVW